MIKYIIKDIITYDPIFGAIYNGFDIKKDYILGHSEIGATMQVTCKKIKNEKNLVSKLK